MTRIVALSGGVGGAKLTLGLAHELTVGELLVVCNTGDDFEHLGFHISPDLDTVLYTLGGHANPETGWGRRNETWQFLQALEELGGDAWFRLGDRDLATHVYRRERLRDGATLSEVARALASGLGVEHTVVPMSDDPVRTIVHTQAGEDLSFQHYFVRERCAPEVSGFTFTGIAEAEPAAAFRKALESPDLEAVVLCPSNPFVSVAPILEIPWVHEWLQGRRDRGRPTPVVAVSPIVGGLAIKGPAAKMMQELGMPTTALDVANHYVQRGWIDGFVLDETDADLRHKIRSLGLRVHVTNTVMKSLDDRRALARATLDFVEGLR